MIFIIVFVPGVHWISWFCGFIVFIKFRNLWAIISATIISILAIYWHVTNISKILQLRIVHLLHHTFSGSGIWAQPSWVPLALQLSRSCIQHTGPVATVGSQKIHFQTDSRACWQLQFLARGTWHLASPEIRDQRVRKKAPKIETRVFL